MEMVDEDKRLMESVAKSVDDIFKFADVNGEGLMNLEEFKEILKSYSLNIKLSQDQQIKY